MATLRRIVQGCPTEGRRSRVEESAKLDQGVDGRSLAVVGGQVQAAPPEQLGVGRIEVCAEGHETADFLHVARCRSIPQRLVGGLLMLVEDSLHLIQVRCRLVSPPSQSLQQRLGLIDLAL